MLSLTNAAYNLKKWNLKMGLHPNQLAPVVRKVDSVIHWISYYQLDSDLSSGQRYPTFEQPGPDG